MMFTNLRMVNFKSWTDTGDVRLAPLTVLFGGNSTGKSGLLQMLLLLKQTTESKDRNLVLQTGTGNPQQDYVKLGTPSEITHFSSKEMEFSVAWNLQGASLRFLDPKSGGYPSINSLEFSTTIHADSRETYASAFTYRQGRDESNKINVSLSRKDEGGHSFNIRLNGRAPRRRRGRPNTYMYLGKCYSIPFEARLNFPDQHYLFDLEWEFEQQFLRLYHLGPLREFPQRIYPWAGERPSDVGNRGEYAVSALLGWGLQYYIEKWLRELKLLQSFDVRPVTEGEPWYRVHVKRHEDGHEVLLPDVGFGVSQVLPVLVQCLYAPEHSTIILEHPDLHLHPSAQAALADFLVEVMKQRKVQLIVESHSEHLLRRLQRRTAEEVLSPQDVALYFCDIKDGVSNLEELQLNVFGEIDNWPDDFFGDMLGDVIETMESSLNRQIVADA